MRLGVCYYPEHWPPQRWAADAGMMAGLGLQVVRIGEFAWARYEPARDRFDWEWLDRAIDTLAAAGLEVILGTPTATPPIWLAEERPDILLVGPDGRRRPYGSRRHTCPTSAAYREESARVVTALVERYGGHPAVTAWQVDNEPGNHDSARCWCGECQTAFTAWLRDRYGTVERLNEAWGTVFWSQVYPSLDAVRLPAPTSTAHSPSLLLARRRFASRQAVAALAEQYAIVAAGAPGRPVTTNLYLGDLDVDARAVAALGGVSSFDNYPHGTSGWSETAYVLDLAAGAADRAWVMEQQPGHVNWTPLNPAVPPGQVRLWALQAALHGIDTLLFFRWRSARHGQEQYHAALLLHDGSPAPVFGEVGALAGEIASLPPGGRRARAVLVHSYEDAWAIEIDPHRRGLDHRTFLLPAHRAARRLGYEVDVKGPDADLTSYDLVLAPALHLCTPERLAALHTALGAGSTVVIGPRSLVKDVENVWAGDPLPAGLAGRLGARVVDFAGLSTDAPLAGLPAPAADWAERLEADDADVIATWDGGPYGGAPAAVRRGSLAYAGFLGADAWLALLQRLTGRDPLAGPDEERFERDGAAVVLDHHARDARVLAAG